MIPKVIHYCWFGRNEKPLLAKRCIASWAKHCQDFRIIEWNEDNFDINSNTYVKEAYECKKYAFVSDYVRLYAMVNYGGIYMDTDVEVKKSLDRFLVHHAFSGFESPKYVPTGIMACESGFPLFRSFLSSYNNRRFYSVDGTMDTITNVETITRDMVKNGLKRNDEYQEICGFALYPSRFFCPLDDATGKITLSNDLYTIHWFSKSWIAPHLRLRSRITRIFHAILGVECFQAFKKKKKRGF